MPTPNPTSSTSTAPTLSDAIIYYLRRSRRLRDPVSPAGLPMIAWLLFASGALLPKVAEFFDVPVAIAAKWISNGNSEEYDLLEATGTLYDALLDQDDPKIRAGAQMLVDQLAETTDVLLRNYQRKARRRAVRI